MSKTHPDPIESQPLGEDGHPATSKSVRDQQKVQHYARRFRSERSAQRYAERFQRRGRRKIDRREKRAVALILEQLEGCRTILDVPCGAGRFLGTLEEASGCRIIGMDSSLEMVALARDRSQETEVNAVFAQADARALPLRNGAVDCVFCNRLFHHIPSPQVRTHLLGEFARVSQRYVLASFFDYHGLGLWSVLYRWWKRLRGRRPDYSRKPTHSQFMEEAENAGLRHVATFPIGPPWVVEHYVLLEGALPEQPGRHTRGSREPQRISTNQ